MAKQLNYTHDNGTNYSASYWKITKLIVDVPARFAEFVFTGYKDLAARTDGKLPIGDRVIQIIGNDFDTGFSEVTLKTKNPQEVGYEACMLIKDVSYIEVENQGTDQETTVTKLKSFFEGSTDC